MADNFLVAKRTARRMERVLAEWANTMTATDFDNAMTRDGQAKASTAAVHRLVAKYPEFFPAMPQAVEWAIAEDLQHFLRLAWDAPDLRAREWFVFSARSAYYTASVMVPIEIAMEESRGDRERWKQLASKSTAARYAVPPMTPFELLLYHFQLVAGRARRCQNPECPAPYFFAKKKWQKYCTEKCSAPAQREQKREWWRTNRAKKRR